MTYASFFPYCPLPGCAHPPAQALVTSSYKDTSHLGSRPILTLSSYLDYISKTLFSNKVTFTNTGD